MIATDAAHATPPSVRSEGVVCCVVDDRQYAIRGADVRLIARADQLHPGASDDGRVGTIAVGAIEVPVYPVGALLARRAAPGATGSGRHIAVTGDGHGMAGWLVDRIVRTALGQDATVVSLPGLVGSPATTWFDGILRMADRSMLLLAPDRLDPRAQPRGVAPAPTRASHTSPWAASAGGSGMAVLFSSPALPAWDAPRYALSANRLVAVVLSLPSMAVPGSAPHIVGIASWRDAVVPVIDYRGGAAGPDDARRRYLVAKTGTAGGGGLVAFRVDANVVLHRASSDDRPLPVHGDAPAFVRGVFTIAGEPVALLDLDRLVDATYSSLRTGETAASSARTS